MGDSKRTDVGLQAGDVLAGKYRVDRILGAGGMGVVVAAHHMQLDEHVAIKFLLPEMLGIAECVVRFEREARAAVKIKNEHVARVIDVGKLENGAPYMVMEYLEGEDLSAWVQRGPMPIEQAVDFVLQACEAIAEAHSLSIVHRDLKPANLFCIRRRDGQLSIKVLDFGISKVTGAPQDVSMTRTASVIGSPVYMSPEQMKSSKSVDQRADIWALGVILYELVTGRIPFQGETVTEIAIHIAMEPMPPLATTRPDAPPELEAVLSKCLEKDPAKRFRNVGELAAELVRFGSPRARQSFDGIQGTLRSSGVDLAPLVPMSSSVRGPQGTSPDGMPTGGTVGNWQTSAGPKSRRTLAGGLAVAVIAVGAAGFLALHKPAPPPEPLQAAAPPAPAPSPLVATPPAPPVTGTAAAEPAPEVAPAPVVAPSSHSAPATKPAASRPAPIPPPSPPAVASPAAKATAAVPPPRPAAAPAASSAPTPKYNPLDHL